MTADSRRRGLDGLRGLAIAGVFLYHAAVVAFFELGLRGSAVSLPSLIAWAGVDLFFVLSGYLITRILLQQRTTKGFARAYWLRRALRILPAYVLFLGFVFWLWPHLATSPGPPDSAALAGVPAWSYWLFAPNVFMSMAGDHGYLPLSITWSLAIEAHFYLLWPLVVRHAHGRVLPAIIVALLVIPFAARVLALGLGTPELSLHVATPFRLDILAAGALIAWLQVERGRLPRTGLLAAGFGLAFGLFCAGMASGQAWVYQSPWLISLKYSLLCLAFFCLVAAAAGSDRVDRGLAAVPGLRFVGKVSYAVYLWHFFVLLALAGAYQAQDAALPPWLAYALLIVVGGLASLAVATVSWYLIERPALRLKRHAAYAAAAPRNRPL